MASPSKINVAMRYLESINDSTISTPSRLPLQPTLKYNSSPNKLSQKEQINEEDLDALAQQLNITTPTTTASSKTALLRSKYETPSATVSSFKTPSNKSSITSSKNGSPIKRTNFDLNKKSSFDEKPFWTKKNNNEKLNQTPKYNKNNLFDVKSISNAIHNEKSTQMTQKENSNKGMMWVNQKKLFEDNPSWATENFRPSLNKSPEKNGIPLNSKTSAKLSPLKQRIDTPASRPRSFLSSPSNSTSRDSPGYEYLCRIQAIKNWLETVLQEKITQEPVQLIQFIRNGIHLAKLANIILPSKRAVFTNETKLEFRHTENINRFFNLLDYMNVPDLFRFELTDLYDAKNVPKVWFCLHALSYMLNKSYLSYPKIETLVGELDFSDDDIRTANRALVCAGLPNFASADTGNVSNEGESSYMNHITSPIKTNFIKPIEQPTFREVTQDHSIEMHTQESQPSRKVLVEEAVQTDTYNPFIEQTFSKPNIHIDGLTIQGATLSEKTTKTSTATKLSPIQNLEDDFPRAARQNGSLEIVNKEPTLTTALSYSEINNYVEHVTKLQSLARGANFRYKMFVDRIMLKSFDDELTFLVSIIRGNLSRKKTVHRHRDDLYIFKDEIVALQSVVRMKLSRNKNRYVSKESEDIKLQSMVRGALQRRKFTELKLELINNELSIIELQSIIKMKKVYCMSSVILKNKNLIELSILRLQSVARRRLYEKCNANQIISHLANQGGVISLQSLIRGQRVRHIIERKQQTLLKNLSTLEELQSVARGGLSRTRLCNNVLITLLYEDVVLNILYAKVRGNNVRKEISSKKSGLAKYEKGSILPIQSIFRGILCRFEKETKLDDIYNDIENIIGLQGIIRGKKLRREIKKLNDYYKSNLDKVTKAQAIIRTNFTQKAYKSLVNMKNPPLSVIRRFAYLLTDNDIDYQEEMELSDLKDNIIEKSKHNGELELQIENLDIKLSLLDKNKITVEEFIKNKNKYKTYKPASNVAINVKNLERLNKSSRERIELYQSMFYFLQTKPIYFVRLYNTMAITEKNSEFCKNLQSYISSLFPIKDSSINHHSREEFYLVKFISSMMQHDIENNSNNISDLTKVQSSFWIEYFLQFNNHTYQRQHLKDILGKLITSMIENDDLDFESDPSEIYEGLVDREIKITGSCSKPRDISPQVAIKDSEVSARFVENLMSLREYTTDVLNLLEKSVSRIPIHVRLVAKQAYVLSQIQFPDKSNQQHLAVAGVIFIKHYIASIFQYPENFGFLAKDPFNPRLFHARAKDNLKNLSRVLLQIFSMKPFSDNFLKPLNDYVTSSIEMTRNLIFSLINVKDLEDEYKLNDYDDIITHERPKLAMKISDMVSLEKVVSEHIDTMASSSDDQLYTIATKLNDVINSVDDYVTLTELGSITLNLNPTTKEDSIADTKIKTLFTQAKRCFLYIIRIQEGADLLELLISGIKPEHEIKFKEIVITERKEAEESELNEKKKPYYKTSLGDLTSLTYHELKKMCLEIILQLETMNQLARKNSFQELLNQIAVDIKTKDSQRRSRKQQLEISLQTNKKLEDKEKFLRKQLSDYNIHIESILSQLQSRPKDKKIFNIIPVFSKQYFYHRELKKSNRLPKFGSYKYSAKKLIDQEVLIDFGGLMHKTYSSSSKLDFMFSCHEVGKFTIEAANGSVNILGAFNTITLDQLLNLQYENKEILGLFDGMVVFDTQNLIGLIFRKFYDIKRD